MNDVIQFINFIDSLNIKNANLIECITTGYLTILESFNKYELEEVASERDIIKPHQYCFDTSNESDMIIIGALNKSHDGITLYRMSFQKDPNEKVLLFDKSVVTIPLIYDIDFSEANQTGTDITHNSSGDTFGTLSSTFNEYTKYFNVDYISYTANNNSKTNPELDGKLIIKKHRLYSAFLHKNGYTEIGYGNSSVVSDDELKHVYKRN